MLGKRPRQSFNSTYYDVFTIKYQVRKTGIKIRHQTGGQLLYNKYISP